MEEVRIGIILWGYWVEGSRRGSSLTGKSSCSGCCLQRCVYFLEIHQVVPLWHVYFLYIWYTSIQELKIILGHLQGTVSALWHTAVDAGFHTLREPGPSLLGVNIHLVQTQVPGTRSTALWQYESYGGHCFLTEKDLLVDGIPDQDSLWMGKK